MKKKKIELDVDFIGDPSQNLSTADEKRISETIVAYKRKILPREKRQLDLLSGFPSPTPPASIIFEKHSP